MTPQKVIDNLDRIVDEDWHDFTVEELLAFAEILKLGKGLNETTKSLRCDV